MDTLRCRQIFCQVVKEGSFSAAARKLQTSKAMISRAVSQLEEDLNVRLLYRTTRKMSPTEEGLAYFERCQMLLEDFETLDKSVRAKHQTAEGKLRISIPSEAFSIESLVPHLFSFMRAYPKVEFDIFAGDRYVDIVDDGFDVAIRIGALKDASYIARKLGDVQLQFCATPTYLSNNETIHQPSDLLQHQLIVDSIYRPGQPWVFKKGDQSVSVKADGYFKVNSPMIVCEALLNGFGVGMCPSFVIQKYINSGQLITVLDEWELMRGGIYAIYSHRQHLSTKVRLFVDHLIQSFAEKSVA
ncbi:LysR family transcriptional regulator [Alteromonadaceae bacterium M269]|nr:LysR family transcriptional regulator [Alteromonadaceae bacterium M269]